MAHALELGIDIQYFPFAIVDGDQMQLLRNIMCAKGRGRMPNMHNIKGKATNLLLLKVHQLRLQTGSSWDMVLNNKLDGSNVSGLP